MKFNKDNPVSQAIYNRRSIYPKFYTSESISMETIRMILDHGNQAPSHKNTEPWRFIVFRDNGLKALSNYLSDWYKENISEEKYSRMKFEKTKKKPLQSQAVVAIVLQRDPQESVPEWEEIAAVACAVQNMYLACHQYKIGCYWSTPKAILNSENFLDLKEGQKCLGLFYMGHHSTTKFKVAKKSIDDKVSWRLYE